MLIIICFSLMAMFEMQAMRSGNVNQLNHAIEVRQWHFIRAGTYLLLEKLKQAVARRLLKKIYLLKVEKGNQLHLGEYHILPNTFPSKDHRPSG